MITFQELDWVNWDRLSEFCPLIDSTFFKWMKEGDKSGVPVGMSILEKGFRMPFRDCPKHINDLENYSGYGYSDGYKGLLRGICLYRLEEGR